jgi:SAM-dependent methyltransferase
MNEDYFNEDYYQHGIETGKSCYQNYRWLPELTMSMAMAIIDALEIKREHTVLDYGCAYGFLVKALRLLHRRAWGLDISPHAIQNVDPEVKNYCFLDSDKLISHFDFCIAKDVFEHIHYEQIGYTLSKISAKKIFVVVPLGNPESGYFAPSNGLDQSHIICEDLYWWEDLLKNHGWFVEWSGYKFDGVKDAYYRKYPTGHGFLIGHKDGFV